MWELSDIYFKSTDEDDIPETRQEGQGDMDLTDLPDTTQSLMVGAMEELGGS